MRGSCGGRGLVGLQFCRNCGALRGAGESLGPDCGFSGLKCARRSACIVLEGLEHIECIR